MQWRWLITRIMIGVVMWVAIQSPQASASPPPPNYDLDTFVYHAAEIVEGQIVRSQSRWDDEPSEVKVTAVLSGTLPVGGHISVSTYYFRKRTLSFAGPGPDLIEAGDTLVFFLVKDNRNEEQPKAPTVYSPVVSGLKLVKDGKARDFRYVNGAGPYVADAGSSDPTLAPFWDLHISIETLRGEIKQSVARVAAWRAEFAIPAVKADAPRLVSLLEERAKVRGRSYYGEDAIAEIVSGRLASLHDIDASYKALAINSGHPRKLAFGFATPQGREFLLQKIADAKEPKELRLACITAIGYAGGTYRSTISQTPRHNFQTDGVADKNNSFYVTRVATLAASGELDDELAARLMNRLVFVISTAPRTPDGKADLKETRSVLERMAGDAEITPDVKQSLQSAIQRIDRDLK